MPDRLTTLVGASSLSVTGLRALSVGGSLTALMVTVKVRTILLLSAWPSLAVTVMVTVPKASGSGVNFSEAVPVAGLKEVIVGLLMMVKSLDVADRLTVCAAS